MIVQCSTCNKNIKENTETICDKCMNWACIRCSRVWDACPFLFCNNYKMCPRCYDEHEDEQQHNDYDISVED